LTPTINALADAAFGILTLAAQIEDSDEVTIDGKVYNLQENVLDDVDGNVLVGLNARESLDNLIAGIILGVGAGTVYAASMTLHPTVSAAAGPGDTMVATAKTPGAAGNSIATTETMGEGSWGAATLENGSDAGVAIQQMAATRTLFGKDVSSRGGGPDWSSADENVHIVDRSGLVTGVGAGAADVVATVPGVTPVSTLVTVE
jgi:hypothetical protein